MRAPAIMLLLTAAISPILHAEDRLNLEQTTIFGNRELPRVTFVTPWRDIDMGIPDVPLTPSVATPSAPLDRDILRLEIEMRRQFEDRAPSGRDNVE